MCDDLVLLELTLPNVIKYCQMIYEAFSYREATEEKYQRKTGEKILSSRILS